MYRIYSQPRDGAFADQLFAQLSNVNARRSRLFILVAYARQSGVSRLAPHIAAFRRNGGDVTAIVGVDQRNTTAQALRALLDVGARVFVFHDENLALTFHPKVYLAHTSEGGAWLSIGSSNLTAGGLYSNYEINAIRLLDLKNDGDRTILQDIDRLFREFSDTSNECCKELNDGIVGDLLAQGYVQDESEARNNLIKAAREKSKRKKMFGTRKLTEPPQELIKAKDAVAKAIGDVKELNEGFWKKLSNWDVSLRSSPGQIQIPIRFIDYLPTLSDPLAMESGAIQSDAFLNVRYSDPEGGEQIVKNARIILYEPAPKHKRPNMELRFTFRTREILESLRANDVLEFRKTSDPDFFMSIRRIPSKRTKAYKGRFGSISDDK